MARASAKVENTYSFKHSSRSLLLKLSMKAFCTGLPGHVMPGTRLAAQHAPLVSSVP